MYDNFSGMSGTGSLSYCVVSAVPTLSTLSTLNIRWEQLQIVNRNRPSLALTEERREEERRE